MQISYEEARKLLKNLPPLLKESLYSTETADTILNIALEYDLPIESIPELAKQTGYTILGILLPQNLSKEIEKELKIDKKRAEEIAMKIKRLILYPIKDGLEKLYEGIEFLPGGEIKITAKEKQKTETQSLTQTKQEDIYREKIEEEEESGF